MVRSGPVDPRSRAPVAARRRTGLHAVDGPRDGVLVGYRADRHQARPAIEWDASTGLDRRRSWGEHRVSRQPLGAVSDPAPGWVRRARLPRAVRARGRGRPSLLPVRLRRVGPAMAVGGDLAGQEEPATPPSRGYAAPKTTPDSVAGLALLLATTPPLRRRPPPHAATDTSPILVGCWLGFAPA